MLQLVQYLRNNCSQVVKKKFKIKKKKKKGYPPQNVRDFSSLIMVVTTCKHWQIIYENSNFKIFSIDSTQ